jgi:peptide/nickel transport system substrate-binding protein
MWIWDDGIQTIPFDRDAARSLLSEMGWSDGDGDGVLDRDGQSLSFGLLMTASSILRQRSAVFLQEQLKLVGIELDIQTVEGNAMGSRMGSRTFDSYFGAWLQDASPGSIAETWTTAGIGAGNFGAYSNTEVDRLVREARSEFDQDLTGETWKQIVEIINADAPAIWMYGGVVTVGIHERFDNVTFPWDEWWRNLWSFQVTPSRYIDRDLIPLN